MPKPVKAYGQILQFPDDMSDDDMALAIKANEHVLNPDYKPPLTNRLKDFARNSLGFDPDAKPKGSIADQAEALANEGANTAARQVPGAPVRQSTYNKALVNPSAFGSAATGSVLNRVRTAADTDIKGQENQQELELLRTEALKPSESGFTQSALNTVGRTIKGAGQIGSDFFEADKNNSVTQYGQKLLDNNPVWIKKLEDIKDEPFLAFKEATGNSAGSMAGMVGIAALGHGITSAAPLTGPAAPIVAAVGTVVSWLGPAAVAALPSYSGIRDAQIAKNPGFEKDAKSKAIAAMGAAAVGAIEVAFGPQQWALAMLTKEGRAAMARKFASTSVGEAAIKGGVLGALQEGSEEIVQNPIEQLASYENPTTKKNIQDTLLGGAMGAIGGAGPGAITAAISHSVERARTINAQRTQQSVDDIGKAESADEAIAAASAAVSQKPVTHDDVLKTVDPTLADIERATGATPTDTLTKAATVKPAHLTDIVLPDNTSVKAQWRIVDADQVTASMTEGVNQPRDRTRAASDIQVKNIANAPDYRRLSDSPVMDVGAPVLDQNGTIVAGNGRFEGISQAHDQGTSKDYVQSLLSDAANKGLDVSLILGMKKPVLVRQITEPIDTRKFAIASNSGGSLQYSGLELAKLDAERMPGIENLDITDTGDIALTPRNLTQLKDSLGSYTNTELAAFVNKNGQLSQYGVKRVRNAILAKAYGSGPVLERLVESTDSDMRNVLGALTRSAGTAVNMDTTNLLQAVDTYTQLKATGQPVDNFLAQQDAFSNPMNPESEQILKFIDENDRSQKKLTDFFKGLHHEVDTTSDDMFAAPTPEKQLEQQLKQNGYDFTIEPTSVRDFDALDSTKKAQKELAEKQARVFRKKVVFVKAKGQFGINGVMVPDIADTIFIDINTAKPFNAVMGHELSHWMEQEKPAVYKQMVKSLKTVIVNDENYAKKYGIEGATKSDITKEIVGDIVGDNFTDKSFWQKVADANPKAFKDIADAIIKFIKGIVLKAKAQGMGSEEWVSDAIKAQNIVADAVAQYTSESAKVAKGKVKFNRSFANITLEAIKDQGYESSINDDGSITVYHGTSKRNAKLITQSGKFKGFPFFALDEKTAKRFGQMADTSGRGVEVLKLKVDPNFVLPTGGYLSARIEGLTLDDDGVYRVTDAKAKFSRDEIENTLIAQHNLSVRNLIHADRMGGLAAPSIAVTDKAHPLTGFGEITLLSDKDLIDPKNGVKIFGSDIYSPRYPSISYDFSGKPIKALNALLADGVTATGDSEYYNDNLQNEPFRELLHSSAAMYQFLSEEGKDPQLTYVTPKPLPDQRLMKFVDDSKDSFDLSNDDEFKAAAAEIFSEKSDRKKINDDQLRYISRDYANQVVTYRDAKRNVGKVDRTATNSKLFRQISDLGLRDKFEEYLVNLVNKVEPKERIFKGYTNSGNRQYIPHDIDTVIKLLKKELRGGENFKYGLGSIRAKYSPQFKSIEHIRKSKGMLMDSEAFDQVKKEVQADLDTLNESLSSYGTFSGFDNVETMLSDAAKMGVSGALKYNGFENVPDSIKVDIQTFLNKLKSMPTEYFEAKVLRAVGLGEFSTAIIPDDSTAQVEDILKKHGITDIRKYKAGDKEDRVKQINKVTHVMFSRATITVDGIERPTTNSEGKPINNPVNFWRWFGDSKVVDKQGRPLVVYHGGTVEGNIEPFAGMIWLAENKAYASYFAEQDGGSVATLFASIKTPFDVSSLKSERTLLSWRRFLSKNGINISKVKLEDWAPEYGKYTFFDLLPHAGNNHFNNRNNGLIDEIKNAGFDGIISPEEGTEGIESGQVYVTFDSANIKSTIGNNGDYSSTNNDIRFSFAGPNAETADKYALETAQQRYVAGDDTDTVRQETGWFKGVDGKWRFEINDSDASIKKPFPTKGQLWGDIYKSAYAKRVGITLGNILDHPKLFAAYPRLADLSVGTQKGSGASFRVSTALSPSMIEIGEEVPMSEVLSALLHEIQHGIQRIEGFATGGIPENITPEMKNKDLPLFSRVKIKYLESTLDTDPEGLLDEIIELLGDEGEKVGYVSSKPMAVGLRGIYTPEIGNVTLRKSYDSPDGVIGKRLKGTSVVRITGDYKYAGYDQLKEGLIEAIPNVNMHGDQDYVALVYGENVSDMDYYGDVGEVLINNAKVAAYINRSTTDNIRFSKESEPPKESKLREFQRMNQDRFNRFTVIKEWMEANGHPLSDMADVYGAEERYHSKAANQLEDFREQQRNPLIEKIQKAGYTLGDVEVFLKMQHAKEANAAIRKINTDPDATAYGIPDQEAADYLADAPKELADLANEFRDITEQTKKLRLDAGIYNTDITDAFDATYKHYIPVKGEADSERGVGKGLKVNFKSKRRLGHGLRDEHVIENILLDHERAILEVERNRVGKHLVMMAAEMQRPDILTIGQPEKRKVLKTSTAYTVDVEGVTRGVFNTLPEAQMFKKLMEGSLFEGKPSLNVKIGQTKDQRVIASASPMLADNEVNVYMNGHAIRVQINDEILARAYTKMGVEQFSDIVAAGRILNGYLSKVYTGYSPEFIQNNLQRDFQSGLINLTGEQGILIAGKAVINYPKMFSDLLKYAISNGKKSTKWIDSYRANGGNTGAAYLSDMERLGNEVSSEYASYQGVIANLKQKDTTNAMRAAGRKLFNVTLKWIYNLNQAGENAMRLAAFKAMIDSGRTVNEASKVAKNITVNFNRRGERQSLPALYLFYNASIQGTAATMHALFKGKHKYQAWALASGMAAVSYTLSSMFGGGSEDDWDEMNEYTKERNMLIKYGDGYLKVPVPYGYGFFWNLGRTIAEAQRTGDLGAAPWHIATSAISEFTPFNDVIAGGAEEFRSDQVFMGLLPTAAKIVAQPAFNKQLFTGSELMPESEFYKSQPDREKMFRGTKGTMYDTVAGWLDAGLGMDVSPETLKYIVRTGTGGAGALVDTSISSAMLKKEGAELDVAEIPFVRKGYMELGIKDKRAAFYKARDEARIAAEKFNAIKRKNDLTQYNKFLAEGINTELLRLNDYANDVRKWAAFERDKQDAVRTDDALSVKEKRLKLKELEAAEIKYYDDYLDVFKSRK